MDSDERRARRVEIAPEIVARARHERQAFGQIYDHYLSRVYAFCWLYSTTREEAEDLTAHTFERALRMIPRYEDRGLPFSSWLLRIAANAAKDRARRAGGFESPGRGPLPLVDEDRIEEWATEWEEAFWLHAHIGTLPEDQREVVRLRFYEDCTFSDVASRMGRSEGAVKQLLRRALRALLVRIEAEAMADA
jgi:RNA polymerase sigma-70 factor (ECF subfamily)